MGVTVAEVREADLAGAQVEVTAVVARAVAAKEEGLGFQETSTKGVADVVSGHGRAPVARLRVGPRFLRSASRLVSRYANVTRAYTQRSFRTRAPRSAYKMLHTVGCTVRREVTGLVPCVDRNDRLERRRTSAR